jgi:hypothetical protein
MTSEVSEMEERIVVGRNMMSEVGEMEERIELICQREIIEKGRRRKRR